MTAGKRRMAREAAEEKKRGIPSPEERAESSRRRLRVDEAFEYAQALVRGTVEGQEKID